VKKLDDTVYVRTNPPRLREAPLRKAPGDVGGRREVERPLLLSRSFDNTEEIAGTLARFVRYAGRTTR